MDSHEREQDETLLEERDDGGTTLDEVLEEASQRMSTCLDPVVEPSEDSDRETELHIDELRSLDNKPLLGEVIEDRSLDHPGRVLVRWRDEADRSHERWLVFLRGLTLHEGDTVLLTKPANWNGWVVTGAVQRGAPRENVEQLDVEALEDQVEIEVDGKRVEVVGQDEIVLRCGEASITLRRNGRILIRGTYVETYSKGTNRIKGGTVQIN